MDDQVNEPREESDKATISTKGNPACGRCHLLVARYAPQVIASSGVYHKECFEAWYFSRYGKRPKLRQGNGSDRHRFQVVEPSSK